MMGMNNNMNNNIFQMIQSNSPMMSFGGARGAMRSIGDSREATNSGSDSNPWFWPGVNYFYNPMNNPSNFEWMGKTMEEQMKNNMINPMLGINNMMMQMGGENSSKKSDNFHYYSNVPSSTTITYEGILNAAYFKLNSKEEKKTINMEISLSSVKNPISNEKEVWIGTLFKSKYDGQKINKLIDLSIALDISGSMSGNRIIMAKKSLIQLIQKLSDDDNITISKFNSKSEQVFP